jgi:hypothetical protein
MESVVCDGKTVIEEDTGIPFQEAVSGTVWGVAPEAFAANVAVLASDTTVTLDGNVKTALLPDRTTTAPPAGATLESVTVQVDEPPLDTLAGLHDKPVNCDRAAREKVDDSTMPCADAVITAD